MGGPPVKDFASSPLSAGVDGFQSRPQPQSELHHKVDVMNRVDGIAFIVGAYCEVVTMRPVYHPARVPHCCL